MKKAELVFVPSPGVGHLVSAMEIAKLLVGRDDRLFVTVLIIKLPSDSKIVTVTESLAASITCDRIRFIILPDDESDSSDHKGLSKIVENKKPHVKEAVSKLFLSESSGPADSPKLAGFVLDMFCTCMIDVANEFEVPSYIFLTSGAAFLGLLFHAQALHDEQNVLTSELNDTDAELDLPSLVNPVPARVLPTSLLKKEWVGHSLEQARKFRRVQGIMVNTFAELESRAVSSFNDGKTPSVYPVGPSVDVKGESYDLGPGGAEKKAEILTWLDDQPPSSVVFLCFGSMGSFPEEQVKEIACALEQSGHHFLWSLRRSQPKDNYDLPGDYTNLTDVLPEGFLDRTAEIGKVIGWAPQVPVLDHPSVGGFVSHCGWNSVLESLWFGVPIATWPMYAEQQFNAFELVKELGLAVEIKMDYRKDPVIGNPMIVSAEEIEKGIKCLMERDSEIRKKVKEMSEKSRKALMDGGSSFSSMGRLIDDVLDNISSSNICKNRSSH